MAVGSVSGQGRRLRFEPSAKTRRLAYGFHGSFLYRWRYAGRIPDRLVIAPIDLRTADPTVAHALYAARLVLAGDRTRAHELYARRSGFAGGGIDANGLSIFDAAPPSEAWARELHGFGWLRH